MNTEEVEYSKMIRVTVYLKNGSHVMFYAQEFDVVRDAAGKMARIEWKDSDEIDTNPYLEMIDVNDISAIVKENIKR